jgi:uncharacterized protein
MTPAQVLQRRQQLLIDQDIEGFAGLFAADGVIEIPFAGPALPRRLEGRTVIAEFSRQTAARMHIDDLEHVAVHETADPEVVIAETVTRATVTATGESFATPSIQVFRIRGGQILMFRDYTGPAAKGGIE